MSRACVWGEGGTHTPPWGAAARRRPGWRVAARVEWGGAGWVGEGGGEAGVCSDGLLALEAAAESAAPRTEELPPSCSAGGSESSPAVTGFCRTERSTLNAWSRGGSTGIVWWCGDVLVWWCDGGVVVWWCGGVMVVWWCGGVVVWRCGGVVVVVCGGVVVVWCGGVVWWHGGMVAWW